MKKFTLKKMMVLIAVIAVMLSLICNNVSSSRSKHYQGIWISLWGNRMIGIYRTDRSFEPTYQFVVWTNIKRPQEVPFAIGLCPDKDRTRICISKRIEDEIQFGKYYSTWRQIR